MPKNLITKENASEYGKRGAKAAAEAKRKKRAMREVFDILLKMPSKAGKQVTAEDVKNFAEFTAENKDKLGRVRKTLKNVDMQTALAIAMFKNAMNGDVRAAEFIRDTAGHKPKNEIDLDTSPIVIVDDIK